MHAMEIKAAHYNHQPVLLLEFNYEANTEDLPAFCAHTLPIVITTSMVHYFFDYSVFTMHRLFKGTVSRDRGQDEPMEQ
jgi:hypothetical protein